MDHGNPESFEKLELFHTRTDLNIKVKDVLQASASAPTYFDNGVDIAFSHYRDGGVEGNCPLLKAIPKAKELFPDAELASALSIAPPRKVGMFFDASCIMTLVMCFLSR